MSITLLKQYPINFYPSDLIGGLSAVQITGRNVNIITNSAYATNQYVGIEFTVAQPFTLYYFNNAATTFVELYDINGNPLITNSLNNTTTGVALYTLTSGKTYYLNFYSTVAIAASTVICTLQGYLAPITTTFFNTGLGIPAEFPSSLPITYSFNSFGAITYTFASCPLVLGGQLFICIADIAISSGTLTVTSSDLTVFTTYNQSFVAGNSIAVVLQANKTTSFTGTIIVSISGLGVLSQINVIPVSFNTNQSPTFFSDFSSTEKRQLELQPNLFITTNGSNVITEETPNYNKRLKAIKPKGVKELINDVNENNNIQYMS